MQMCAHLDDTPQPPILNSHLTHCFAGYISVACVDAVRATQCELPGMTGCLYQQTTAIRVGRHWLQRRKDRDGPSPHLKKQCSVCLQCMARQRFLKRDCSARGCLHSLEVWEICLSKRRQLPQRTPPLSFSGVTSDLSRNQMLCIIWWCWLKIPSGWGRCPGNRWLIPVGESGYMYIIF